DDQRDYERRGEHRADEAHGLSDHVRERQDLRPQALVRRLGTSHRCLPKEIIQSTESPGQRPQAGIRRTLLAFSPKIAASSASGKDRASMSAMVSPTTVGPPSGMSVPNST